MAATRKQDQTGLLIIDSYTSPAREILFFEDDRFTDNYIRINADGSSEILTGADPDIALEDTTRDTDDYGTPTLMTVAEIERWVRIDYLERILWPSVLRADVEMSQENDNTRRRMMEGVLVGFAIPIVTAVQLAINFVGSPPGQVDGPTKPPESALGIADIPGEFHELADDDPIADAASVSGAIGNWKIKQPKSLNKAFRSLVALRRAGWTRLWLHIDYDGFMRVTLGRGTPETSWEWVSFHGDEDKVTRDINNVASKMYDASISAADRP